jgi:hypothetical protein
VGVETVFRRLKPRRNYCPDAIPRPDFSTERNFIVSSISNISSPGAPTQVVTAQPIRQPLAGFIPFSNYGAHPAVVGPAGAEVRTVPAATVDRAGGKLNRVK